MLVLSLDAKQIKSIFSVHRGSGMSAGATF